MRTNAQLELQLQQQQAMQADKPGSSCKAVMAVQNFDVFQIGKQKSSES